MRSNRAKACTTGLTDVYTKEPGRTTRWKAKECSSGLMVESMRVNTSTIRRRVGASSTGKCTDLIKLGRMVANTTDSGSTANKTELATTPPPQAKLNRDNGRKESALRGFEARH